MTQTSHGYGSTTGVTPMRSLSEISADIDWTQARIVQQKALQIPSDQDAREYPFLSLDELESELGFLFREWRIADSDAAADRQERC